MLTFINCIGMKWGTVVQDVSTYTKLMALILIICAGLLKMSSGKVALRHVSGHSGRLKLVCVRRRNSEL